MKIVQKKRGATILLLNVGKYFFVHNGKSIIKVLVTEEMVGYKFGEFAFTRKRGKDSKK